MRLRSVVFGFSALLSLFALPAQAYRISVWVPAWDNYGLNSMQLHAGKVGEANPIWYLLAADGTITKTWNAENPTLRAALTGADLIPTIQNFVNKDWDGQAVATLVSTPAGRERHAEALTQLAVANGYQGIDIDYESVPAAARANFTAFVELLAQKLHGARKQLSVTVHPKTSDTTTRNGPGSQDWRALGAAADTIKIMAYNYSWSTSPAGPIAPLDWLNNVVTYAESVIPAKKIIVGLPWYGYDWLGTSGTSLLHSQAVAIAQQNNATITRDAASGEATFTYSGRTVFFQDATAYTRKVDSILARHPGIGGFAHWRAGGEDPATWNTVARVGGVRNDIPAQTAPESFSISGPAALSVTSGKVATASYQVTPINGFNQSVAVTVQILDGFAGAATITPTATVGIPAILTVTPVSGSPAAAVRLRIRMVSGTIVNEQIVTISVEAAPLPPASFTMSGPATLAVIAGKTVTATYRLTAVNGFNQSATVTVQPLDNFAGEAVITPTARVDAPAVLTVTPSASFVASTVRLRIRMVSGVIATEQFVTVAVEAAPAPARRRSAGRG